MTAGIGNGCDLGGQRNPRQVASRAENEAERAETIEEYYDS